MITFVPMNTIIKILIALILLPFAIFMLLAAIGLVWYVIELPIS